MNSMLSTTFELVTRNEKEKLYWFRIPGTDLCMKNCFEDIGLELCDDSMQSLWSNNSGIIKSSEGKTFWWNDENRVCLEFFFF